MMLSLESMGAIAPLWTDPCFKESLVQHEYILGIPTVIKNLRDSPQNHHVFLIVLQNLKGKVPARVLEDLFNPNPYIIFPNLFPISCASN